MQFNVGGQLFETTTTTLANAGRNSMLGALLDASWNVSSSSPGSGVAEYFVDRNPACFAVLLDLLRTGSLHVPPHLPEKLLYREALYYGLLVHVRAARWGAFDDDRLRLAASVSGRAPGDGTAIRASPDALCTAAPCACTTRCWMSAARCRSTTRRRRRWPCSCRCATSGRR